MTVSTILSSLYAMVSSSSVALLATVLSRFALSIAAPPTVTLPYGQVAGNYERNGTIAAYHAIPYAAPPIGDRRLRFPEAPLRWQGVLNSTTYGPICPQVSVVQPWSEDCLSLDIFVPEGVQAGDKLPVLVEIPGGIPRFPHSRMIAACV